jgi:hypothetical protein
MTYADPRLQRLDRVLTQVSVGYRNEAFVSDVLFPTVRVGSQSDLYNVFDRRGFNTFEDIRAPGAKASEIPPRAFSRSPYFAQEHALVDIVPRETGEEGSADAGDIDALADATEELTDAILLGKEKAAADLALTTANYETGHFDTLSSGEQWNEYETSTPIADFKEARRVIHRAILREPNVVVLGFEVGAKLEDHPDFIERIKYSERGVTTDDIIAQVTGVGRIVRAGAMINGANVGQAEDNDYLWGRDAVFAWVPARPGRRIPAYGYEFLFPYRRGVRGTGGRDMPTERWYDEDHDSDKIRVRRRYDLKHIAVDTVDDNNAIAGFLYKDAVAAAGS